ncbi:hypothetical protein [Phyllobacterium myrsinacearum]|uniref:Uncharacterized protein n=1 Tax=Phyllobacterium myrsinacearum TaxID=28101 RepID=A0A839EU34_9HYPH|nr:hypothetical protein [Phyllobacterium myrsinacearum]MBA8881004.1 hypothetical protein [Phyllobacterium myrsinacearum]
MVSIDHILVELDQNNGEGMFSAIPEDIGTQIETSMGGVVNVCRPPGSMTFRTNAEFATVMLAPVPSMQAAFASDDMETQTCRSLGLVS